MAEPKGEKQNKPKQKTNTVFKISFWVDNRATRSLAKAVALAVVAAVRKVPTASCDAAALALARAPTTMWQQGAGRDV